jgi:hypothetical protein
MLVGKGGGANDGSGDFGYRRAAWAGPDQRRNSAGGVTRGRTSSLNFRKPAGSNEFASNESYQMVNLYWRF